MILAAGAAVCLVFAAITDWREYRIPNGLVAGIAMLALASAVAAGSMDAIGWREAGVVFAGASALYAFGLMGGGDVKLLAACALWCPGHLLGFVFLTACCGGLLAVAQGLHAFVRKRAMPQVPYGVAISAAALVNMTQHFNLA